jgi:Tol biopolymer transport system component
MLLTGKRRAAFAILPALLVAALTAVPADAAQFGRNKVQYRTYDWQIVHTEHFDVYFYAGSESIAEAVGELAEQANADYSRILDHELTAVIPIIAYASHNDFQQTNVSLSDIDEGVGGFTELFKNRVVIPFTGSYQDLRHVLYHELAHVFMFDIVYGGLVESVVRQAYMNPVPLWFAEGLAEYVSEGWDPEAEMILRDLTISDIVVPLDRLYGGYLVYKEGQSVLGFVAERYGPEKIAEIVRHLARTHSIDRALKESVGLDTPGLSREWERWLRERYWPEVGERGRGADVAKLLTDHTKDASYFNMGAEASPDGKEVVYLSDRSGYTDAYVVSSIDGRVLRKLVSGESSDAFETLHILRTGFAWSPDGRRLCLVAKAGRSDAIQVIDAGTGELLTSIRFPLDGLFTPTWSPAGDRIAFIGTRRGASNLYVTGLEGSDLVQLTDDLHDERDPEWSPDGSRIAFASDRGSFAAPGAIRNYDLYSIDPATREVTLLVATPGQEAAPTWSPDGAYLAFESDRDGSPDLFVADLAESLCARMTDLIGGARGPSWARDSDWLAFSVYGDGGWDVASVKSPVERFADVIAKNGWRPTISRVAPPDTARGDSVSLAASAELQADVPPEALPGAGAAPDSAAPPGDALPPGGPPEDDTVRKVREEFRAAAATEDGSKEELARKPGTVERYRTRFSPDWVSGGLSYTSGYGLAGAAEIAISDILGNHRFYIATDFFSNIESSNFYVLYEALGRRANYSVGVYNFKEYYYSDKTRLGEDLGEKRYFSERSYGVSGGISYPFTRFTRLEFDISALTLDRQFAEETETGQIEFTDEEVTRSLFIPALRLVNDTTLWGIVGPVSGGRSSLSLSKAWETGGDFTYLTAIADVRRYARLGARHTLALKLVGARSTEQDAQSFYMGGVNSVRGYDDFEFHGHNLALASVEFRYPFIDLLDVASPIPFTLWGVRGVAFFDAGAAWDGDEFRGVVKDNGLRFEDVKASYGIGIRMRLSFLVLRLDRAWQTDLRDTGSARTHFALGAEF